MRTKPLTQKEILADILVTTKYTLKVLGGFVISGIVSVFGLYPLVASFFKSETALYLTIGGFIGLLILIDSIKRNTLSRYYNSKLKNIILASRVRGSYLNISIMSIIFVLLIDGSGAWLTGVSGAKYYTENKTTNSEEYKPLQANAESGTANKQIYLTLKSDYNSLRAEAVSTCNQKWSVPRYRTKNSQCVDKWDANNKAPSQELLSQKSEVSTADYKNIADENRGFLDEYLQYIIFTVLILLTGLLQYLTISEIKEDYEDLEDSLTANRISNLQTALATAQDIEEQHEKTTFENKEDMQRKKNEQLRDMDGIADKREIVFNAKAISNGNLGLQRIASNSNAYVPTDEAKAGFYYNPFGDESNNNQSVKRSHKEPLNEYEEKSPQNTQPLNEWI
ncbi:MAG: Unknown protein [uncultured Sulfurovum sp.]|uniref:Uncharacterized protein n=1 Tax=uncultured Sulfurovum sp. TaxID=269237 RepID=A0A6S6S032_9BACT|nr:MAG: Unknown protein [uncultured Sulfurovum sp.]